MADTHHERLLKALALIRQLREQNQNLERALHEPIAVIGLGCRFPRGESPEAFWRSLRDGVDAVREIPRERWDADVYYDRDPAAPGKMYTRQGAFLDGIDRFDAQFFGIAPREAVGLDPQQRLLLEVSWEALEHAGLAVDRLSGSRTGVFLGICGSDYAQLLARGGLDSIDAYLGTGTAVSVAAGRLSYALGLQGPCVALDTACSSSLVAVSQACDSLRAGRCDLALAAGVNVILSPQTSINFSKAQMLAPDGRCKTFDAAADGYGRGEGCGVVVLRRLSGALRLGDPVQAVIRGSAVNQDGHSQGLTAPNGPAQQRVIAEALANAGLQPREVQYVEAHGTGTVLGDPIEVQALASALCGDRLPEQPLLIGSVKTNIGHLEGAAGIAALIKVILCLQHGEIPPHLHFQQPNPHIPWDRLPVRVTRERTLWPAGSRRRIAGVSAFGASGTNAHVVLEDAPAMASAADGSRETPPKRTHNVLTLSTKTAAALRELAERYAGWLEGRSDEDLANVCFTANTGRSHFDHRAALVCASPEQARLQLIALARGEEAPMLFRGESRNKPKVAFLFTGQGASYPRLGRSLYEAQPVFRAALYRCAGILEGVLDLPLPDALWSQEAMSQARYLQPALFAVAYGLTELWRAWGVEPDAVLGHSLGEYAAACAAGVLTVDTGLRLVAERGRLMQDLPAGGAMAAVFGKRELVADVLADSLVSMAADNGSHVVLSGPATVLAKALDELLLRGCVSTRLEVSHAFHSRLVEPILAELDQAARSTEHQPARLPLVLDRTGDVLQPGQLLQPGYWAEHARQPVEFSRSTKALAELGCTLLLEIGPAPVLLGLAQHCWPVESKPPSMLPSLRRGREDQEQIAESLARLYVAGVTPDFAGFDRPWPRRKVSLPTYPFQRRRYWVDEAPQTAVAAAKPAHPLLGDAVRLASGEEAWTLHLSCESQPYLAAHSIEGTVVVPGSMYAALVVAAFGIPCALRDLLITEPLCIEPQGERTVQLVLSPEQGGSRAFQIFSAPTGAAEGRWTLHARGAVQRSTSAPTVDMSLAELRPNLRAQSIPDNSWSRLKALWCGPGEALGEVALTGERADGVHPAVLDAILQTAAAAAQDEDSPGDLFLLWQVDRLDLFETLPSRFFCHARRRTPLATSSETRTADLRLLDGAERQLGEIRGFVLKRVDPSAISFLPRPDFSRWLYRIEWKRQPRAARTAAADFLAEPSAIVAHEAALPAAQAMAGLEHAAELSAGLDKLSLAYLLEALGKLGWHPAAGHRIEPSRLARRLGIHSRHLRLFRRLLEVLAEEGLLAADESGWIVCRVFPATNSAQLLGSLLPRLPAGRIELRLLSRCGGQLAGILQGNVDPLGLLFPQDGIDGAEQLYHQSPVVCAVGAAVGRAFARATSKLTPQRRLRVLEIGAGTGGTTASLLPLAPAHQTDYVYSDVSASFFPAAERRFANYSFVSYRVLDIERDPLPQGFAAHSYDVVIAANVLHATANLPGTLEHVRQLLAPAGLLLLVEATSRQRWLDLTFGLLDGWWKFDDSVRSDHPLLDVAQWTDLLGAQGFLSPAAFTPGGKASTQAVMMARGPLEVRLPVAAKARGAWLILTDAGGLGVALAARLRRLGQHVVVAEPGDIDTGGLDRLIEQAVREGDPLRGVVHLRALDAQPSGNSTVESLRADTRDSCASVLDLAQSLARRRGSLMGFWLVTRGAQAVESQDPLAIAQALLVGLGKALALEQPELKCRRIDLDPQPGADEADDLLEMLLSPDGEDEVAIRGASCLVPRLTPLSPPEQMVPDRLHPDAAYLVTGGLGALGLEVARWLAGRGARHLILIGRHVPDEGAEAVIRDLSLAGCEAHAVQADVTRAEELAAALAGVTAGMPALRGVVHAAGVFDDDVLLHQTWERFEATLAPKVVGAWNLHRQTLQSPLDFFVLFSSYASVVGLVGGANYTAGSAFLDVLAHYRKSLGLPALSVNWGPWSGAGMATVRPQRDDKWWKVPGLQLMAPADALGALELLSRLGHAQATVLRADWAVVARSSQLARQLPVLSGLLPAAELRPRAIDPLPIRLESASPEERHRVLRRHVREAVAQVLRLDVQELDDERGFFDQGMDSLMAVELRNRLQADVGGASDLSSTLVFDQPSVASLSDYLASQLLGRPRTETKLEPRVQAIRGHEPVAIIGLSCRFPGAGDPEAFWDLLRDAVDAVREVPAERWDVDAYYDPDPDAVGKMYVRHGAFLNGVDRFDPHFFSISPREAVGIDPQHRLLLEVAWEALERAGIPPGRLAGSRTGVFIGINGSDYASIAVAAGAADRDLHFAAGIAPNAAAGRLAYTLGLQGPALAIDTACSSSLVAVHQACQSLYSGESDLALAGGASLMLNPLPTVTMSRSRMLSPDGRSKTFDAAADGFGRGEGCGLVLLKRLADAQRDGDTVLALVQGSAVNQDGRSSGLTVPNGAAQEALIGDALSRAGISAAAVQYVEAHGTGTSLGDPIEVQALAAALGLDRPHDQPLLIGSVKTNIGHLEAAAGIAGLIKVVLSLQHAEIPPQLHFRHPNPHIPWERLAVRVVTERTRWTAVDRLRVAGVSSFGFSGTNAHVLLREYPAPGAIEPKTPARPAHILSLSAKSAPALVELAERYAHWLESRSADDLANACFSANTGRTHFEHRAALVCSSPEQACAQLAALVRGEEAAGLFRGRAPSRPRLAFLFSGEEAHYSALAHELYIHQPVFRAAFDRCTEALRPVLDRSLTDALRDDETFWQVAGYAHAARFAIAHALTELWISWGVKPDTVLGRGLGEYAAACAAGTLTVEDGLRLVADLDRTAQPVPWAKGTVAPAEGERQVIIQIGPSPGRQEIEPLAESLAKIYVAGVTPDWLAWDSPWTRRRVALPTYPFQRERYWVASSAPALLGRRHDSASGELVYTSRLNLETQPYFADHQVFDTVIAPAAYYMALALSAVGVPSELRDIQFAEPLLLVRGSRDVQLILGEHRNGNARSFQVFSAVDSAGPWTLHARGMVLHLDGAAPAAEMPSLTQPSLDLEELYAAFARRGVHYGPAFHGIEAAWAGSGEARGRIRLPETEVCAEDAAVHPALLDACLQVTAVAMGHGSEDLYVPLQIEQAQWYRRLTRTCWCHAKLRSPAGDSAETITADLTLTDEEGRHLGQISGLVLRRTDRAVLFRESGAATADWLYETRWREAALPTAALAVDFLPERFGDADVSVGAGAAARDLVPSLAAHAADLDRLSRQYALAAMQNLGWRPQPNEVVEPESLAKRLGVVTRYHRLLRRILEMFSEAGWLEPHENGAGMRLQVSRALPFADPAVLYDELSQCQPANRQELSVLARCGARLDEVLTGRLEPLGLLFPTSGDGAAELYHQSPVARLLNSLTADLLARVASVLPAGRRLRVLEVGAGTGGTTAWVLPRLPQDRTEYVYTDLSAGFLSAAQERFAAWPYVRYRAFNVEEDPAAQGLPVQGYDVVIAAQVLHAVVDLPRALRHLRRLLAPGGLLVLVEGFRRQEWLDLTFGLLPGWWQFDDSWRHDYPLLGREKWLQLLEAEGFQNTSLMAPAGLEEEQAILLARAPRAVANVGCSVAPGGVWLVFTDRAGLGAELERRLADRNQSCVLIEPRLDAPGFASLLDEALLAGASLAGVLYLWGLNTVPTASAAELDAGLEISCVGALHLAQALVRSGRQPATGLWLLTRSAQAVGSTDGPVALAQAPLWGLGRVIAREHPELRCRMLDLDPRASEQPGFHDEARQIVTELLSGESEDQIALRSGRHVLRLTRWPEQGRLTVPAGGCALRQDSPGNLDGMRLQSVEPRAPQAGEVQLRVRAAGLNFRDVLNALGLYPGEAAPLGSEFAGEVTALGPGVEGWKVGDPAFGFAPGAFAATVTVPAAFVAAKPARLTFEEAASVPIAFSTAALAWERARLRAGDLVLIHSGAGGVGLAAIQLARRVGAEVWATASFGKHDYLQSIGVRRVFDSRSLDFAGQVREASGGRGVDVVLNSLSGEGYIAATLRTLAVGGRFIEIGRRGIWTAEEIMRERPDIEYSILALNDTMRDSPGEAPRLLGWLASVLGSGELAPLRSEVFPLAEAPAAFRRMQTGKHVGKIVLRMPPLAGLSTTEPGTFLITGGLGGLGLEVSRWLVGCGVRHLALMGRRPPNSTAEAAVAGLRQDGCAVRVFQGDVSQTGDLENLFQEIERSMPPLRGVFHLAGILDDGAIVNQSRDRFQAVTAAKIQGAWHLDRLTAGQSLSCFVMFSSMAAVLGSTGQSNHGAANAFLDALAWDRRRRGLPGISINWGAWSGVGAAAKPELQARWAEQGIGLIAPEQGLAVLQRVMAEEPAQVGVLPVDWRKLERHHAPHASPPLLAEVLMRERSTPIAAPAPGGDLRRKLAQTAPEQRQELLVNLVLEEASQVLHLDASHRPEPRQGFTDMGMDSLMAVEMRNRLQKQIALDPPLSATALFDYPTIEALARHLGERIAPLLQGEAAPGRARPSPSASEPIAIIGLGCRMPGAANPQAFWRLLRDGVDAVSEVPANRWDIDAYYNPDPDSPGGISSRFGAFLDDIDLFDAGFFRISGREAEALDPQQRLLLEVTWEALEHAGLAADKLAGSRTGVFIGMSTTDYGQRVIARGPASIGAYMGTGLAHSVAAGRLSYFLGLHGPCLALDTACSSSLVAVSQACDSLRNGHCDLALAGGVNVILSPELSITFTKARMLAPDGRSKTFDDAADGFGRGEGCGVVVLKRLSDALRDRDPILAVVRAAAVNQDGRTSGLTTPNGPVQQQVIREALDLAGVAPAEVQYVETHGTGTELGDPIEVQALAAALGDGRPADQPVLIGSVKTNIGHLEAAAGIAGLIKVVLSLQHQEIPPHLHFHRPNRHIPWERLPVRVASKGCAWPAGNGRRLAGVSSFGLGGTNAHVLVEAAPPAAADVAPPQPERTRHVLCLSAESVDALRELAHRYAEWFADNPHANLADVCFAAATGRNHFECRAALIIETVELARKQLTALAAGELAESAQAGESGLRMAVPILAREAEPGHAADELARQYRSGMMPAWDAWYGSWPRRRLALPTYPFQRQRYWVESVPATEPRRDDTHSLLGSRQRSAASGEVVYATRVGAGRPAYLEDHRVFGAVVAPGAFYVAMAVAAEGIPCRIENVVFPEPLLLDDKKSRALQLVLTPSGSREIKCFQVLSAASVNVEDKWTLHARGEIRVAASAPSTPSADLPGEVLDTIRQSLRPMPTAELYARLEASGIKYGPSLRRLEALWSGEGEALGEISQPAGSDPAVTPIHPAALDCCFQVMAAGLVAEDQGAWVLSRAERVDLLCAIPPRFYCLARMRSANVSDDNLVADYELLDEQSRRLGRIEGLVARRLREPDVHRRPDNDQWFYRLVWKERPLPVPVDPRPAKGEVWLVFADAGGLGGQLADTLRRQGRECVCVSPRSDYDRVLEAFPAEASLAGVVHLQALDAALELPATAADVESAVELACTGILQLVQALSRRQLRPAFGLWLLTRSAQIVDGDEEVLALAQAAVWGLGRVVAQEHPELRCRLLDLDPVKSDDEVDRIVSDLLANDAEDQLSLRGGSRMALRVARWPESGRLEAAGEYSQLHQAHPGSLDGLRLRTLDPRPPQRGEVQVRVRAAGLNFRDVLNALGLYPGEAGPLGGEFAGEVTAMGPGVEDLRIGDSVFGFGDGTMAGTVTTPAVLLARMPEALTFSQAAGAPTAFATAWLALELAGLRSGERVLIHAAAGGVGLAAVQLAQRWGAEVFATASAAKHPYLHSLGVRHVFNSRSTEFSAQVLSATGGKGVDVVLNSLSGEGYIAASLTTLAERGRFIEIGKRGVWQTADVAALRPDVKYSLLALDEVMREPRKAGLVLKRVAAALTSGELKPLRHQVYSLAEAPAAFRRMQAGRNIGKLILRMPGLPKAGAAGTYLVTGGLGGLGLEVVHWLARRGVRHIAVMGRRPPGPAAEAALAELRGQGCTLRVFEGDVSTAADLEAVLREIERSMQPLRGVFHAAGVLDDGALTNQSWDRFRTVLAPKVEGAWLLDRLTAGCKLNCFVLFSSMASLLGSPGQGNYAAANAFLDALAHDRRRRGLPGVSINWGAWAQVGAAANPELQARLRQQGIGLIPPADGIAALEQIVLAEPVQAGVLSVDWNRLVERSLSHSGRPLLEEILTPENSPRAALSSTEELSRSLAAAAPENRRGIAAAFVQRTAARILGLDISAVGATQNLHAKGLDSLMAVEMRNDLSSAVGHTLPATLLYDYPTPAAVADYLLTEVLKLEPLSYDSAGAPPKREPTVAAIPKLDALSEDELETLLDSKLAEVLGKRETP